MCDFTSLTEILDRKDQLTISIHHQKYIKSSKNCEDCEHFRNCDQFANSHPKIFGQSRFRWIGSQLLQKSKLLCYYYCLVQIKQPKKLTVNN